MKNKNYLFVFVTSLLSIIFFTVAVYAAQPAAGARAADIKPAQSAGVTIKPLQQPLTIQQGVTISLCTSLQGILKDATGLAYTDLRNAAGLNQTDSYPEIRFKGIDDTVGQCYVCTPPENIRNCCQQQQSYSVQDQVKAGCVNSDTIQQCMDKLLRQCIINVTTKANVKAKLKQDQQKADALAAKAKQLSDKLNQLINALP
jgi:hypothetical protein